MKSALFVATGIRSLLVLSSLLATAFAQTRTPVVLFPGWHMTKLEVTVRHQTVAPDCPAGGTFEDWLFSDQPGNFSQVCQDKLLTLVYNPWRFLPMPWRFANQHGVSVSVKDYGSTSSAPFYEDLYKFLESHGYKRNLNIRVAGYDSRLTPDLGLFLLQTIVLIERTYADNANTPVHLLGHSNGPLYVQYLLTHTPQAWKNKYIHGFTPLAGNWPGQGFMYSLLFTGFNLSGIPEYPSDAANAKSSALMYQSHPSTYMSAADPDVFKDAEVVIQAGSATYTPRQYRKLFDDAGLSLAQEFGPHYIGFVQFQQPAFFPDVDVYAEKGSGLDTVVGLGFPTLTVGQLVDESTQFFMRPGDTNQEDITNDSIRVWDRMKCYRFQLTDNPGVGHMELPGNPAVLERLLRTLERSRSVCR